jgi:hypothetical protein
MNLDYGVSLDAEGAALDRFRDLFVVLEDLIKRVADSEDPSIRHKRADVRAQLIQLESDTTPISHCLRAVAPEAAPHSDATTPAPRHDPVWGRPAIAALTAATVAITLMTGR